MKKLPLVKLPCVITVKHNPLMMLLTKKPVLMIAFTQLVCLLIQLLRLQAKLVLLIVKLTRRLVKKFTTAHSRVILNCQKYALISVLKENGPLSHLRMLPLKRLSYLKRKSALTATGENVPTCANQMSQDAERLFDAQFNVKSDLVKKHII